MVRQNKEIHKRIELDTVGQTLKMGMLASDAGTAAMDYSVFENATGTGTSADSINCDGYIAVDIGGTTGFIPIFRSLG